MAGEKRYYVYIMASKSRVLHIGITSSLYGAFRYVNNAIARETELKKGRREKKVALIERVNPTWEDLAADWGTPVHPLVTADSSLRSE